ncbi:MAG: PLxRFG domain-containing protein, partial [Armatimonadia bacterium]
RAMLQTLVGMGKIDVGIDSDAKARASDQGPVDAVMRKLQGVNTRIETINRATAAIAAYRAYLQKYGSDKTAAATQYAADVVSNTHGSYDGFNTPRALASDVGRVVGQFKRFQIIQISMLAKLLHTTFKGSSKEEKLIAYQSLKFITAHMAVLGGALGVPFVKQLGEFVVLPVLQFFGVLDDDEPKDLEKLLRDAVGGGAVADLLIRGVPSAVGLESLGKKVTMENVASLLPFTDVDVSSRDGLTQVIVGLLGPSAGLSLKMAEGLGLIGQGDYYKGLEKMMPTGVANAMKGYRFSEEGVTMRNGDTVLTPDDLAFVDAAFQMVGLPTNTLSDRDRTQKVVANTDKFFEEKAAQVKRDYVKAFKSGDSGAMQDAREAWMTLQDARIRNGYRPQPLSTLFRAPQEQLTRERNVANGVEFNRNNRFFVVEEANS